MIIINNTNISLLWTSDFLVLLSVKCNNLLENYKIIQRHSGQILYPLQFYFHSVGHMEAKKKIWILFANYLWVDPEFKPKILLPNFSDNFFWHTSKVYVLWVESCYYKTNFVLLLRNRNYSGKIPISQHHKYSRQQGNNISLMTVTTNLSKLRKLRLAHRMIHTSSCSPHRFQGK